MSQFILLETYWGPSDFVYEVTCTGRQLTRQEALDQSLVTKAQLRRFAKSDYLMVWYEVQPGNEVTFDIAEWQDGGWDSEKPTFVIPDAGLPNPPVDLDRDFRRAGRWLHEYYRQHCLQK